MHYVIVKFVFIVFVISMQSMAEIGIKGMRATVPYGACMPEYCKYNNLDR